MQASQPNAFQPTTKKDREDEPGEEEHCLDCGKLFAADLHRCQSCGWSYHAEYTGDEK